MLKSIVACAAGACMAFSAAQASVVDLNQPGLNGGDILSNQIAGLSVSAQGAGAPSGGNDFAVIFDTTDTSATAVGGNSDPDLRPPFRDPDNPSILNEPGNILIVAEGGCNGVQCRQDDNAGGGFIDFFFDTEKLFNSFSVFDLREDALRVQLFDTSGAEIFNELLPGVDTNTTGPNNNEFKNIDLGGIRFQRALFTFADSGAIGDFNITEVPLPGAALLMLTGLAGAAFGRRRTAA